MSMTASPWSTLESVPGLAATRAEWQRRSGSHFDSLEPFLRPTGDLAAALPCLTEPGCGCAHEIVCHSADDIVAVCQCDPRQCSMKPVTKSELAIFEIDRSNLGAAIALALGARVEHRTVDGLHLTWQIGQYAPRLGFQMPLFMTVQVEPVDCQIVLDRLATKRKPPFIFLSPTAVRKPDCPTDQIATVSLDEAIDWTGSMSARHKLKDVLADYLQRVMPPEEEQFVLRNDGETWTVVFQGEVKSLRASKGMNYISTLLSHPNRPFHCTEFHGCESGLSARSDFDDTSTVDEEGAPRKKNGKARSIPADAVADSQTAITFRKRLDELKIGIEEAEEFGNNERAAILLQEQNELSKAFAKAIGYQGRLRRTGPTEDARQAVDKAIGRALKSIKKIHPPFWKHLDTSLNYGLYSEYRPSDDIHWHVQI